MRQRDVVGDAFAKTEENHRDSLWVTILENPAIQPKAEYQVRKWANKPGYVDLLITNNKLYTVIEFKNIPITFLELSRESITDRAEQLQTMKLNKILELKFKGDKYRASTIRNWIDGRANSPSSESVRNQLRWSDHTKGSRRQKFPCFPRRYCRV